MRICVRAEQGSALLISLLTGMVMALALASYLALIQNQAKATYRSATWNAGIAVAEAGIEEALSHLNLSGTNLTAVNGWKLVQGKYWMRNRAVGEQICVVGMSTNIPPVLVAQGKVKSVSGDEVISRIVKVATRFNPPWRYALMAQQGVAMKGNNVTVDSFDSADPTASTNGRYDSAKHRDNGTVATNSRDPNMLDAGNANIWGKLATGPGGIGAAGANSSVGNSAWHDAGKKGIQPGASSDDMNMSFAPVISPITGGFTPTGGTVNGTNYTYVLGAGDYTLSGSKDFTGKVIVTGPARLVVSSDVKFSGNDFIYLQPGASLILYVASPDASFAGKGVVNTTGAARNFLYFGLPSNKSLTFGGNADFVGAVYAPNADLKMGGGGSTTYDFVGSMVARNIVMNGKVQFHYDEQLSLSAQWGYVAISWDEVKQTWDEILANNTDLTAVK